MILGVTAFYNKLLVRQPCKNPALDSFFFKKTPGCYRDRKNFHRINISLVKCICTSLQKLSKHSRSHTHVTISPNLTNFADTLKVTCNFIQRNSLVLQEKFVQIQRRNQHRNFFYIKNFYFFDYQTFFITFYF